MSPQPFARGASEGRCFFFEAPPRQGRLLRARQRRTGPSRRCGAALQGENLLPWQAMVYRHGVQRAQHGACSCPGSQGCPGTPGARAGSPSPPRSGLAMHRAGGDVRCAVRHRHSPRGVAIRRADVVKYNCGDVCGLSFTSAHGGQASTQARGICYCVLETGDPTVCLVCLNFLHGPRHPFLILFCWNAVGTGS